MSKQGKQWYSKFVWRDWLRDKQLRLVSFAARGLWMDMLAAMHEGDEIGFLTVNGKAATNREIARLIGAHDQRQVDRLLKELEAAGVFSRDQRGAIFSRRCIRDVADLQQSVADGKQGGNPKIKKNNDVDQIRVNPPLSNLTRYESELEKKERDPSDLSSPAAPGDVTKPPAQPDLPLAQQAQPAAPERPPAPPPTAMPKPISADVQCAFDAWNDLARKHALPTAQVISPARRAAIAKRIAESGGIDGWMAALAMIPRSSFLLGANSSGWRANLDFMCQASSFTKLIEGTYTDQKPIPVETQPKPGSRLANLRELNKLRAFFAADDDPVPEDDPDGRVTIDLTADEMEPMP